MKVTISQLEILPRPSAPRPDFVGLWMKHLCSADGKAEDTLEISRSCLTRCSLLVAWSCNICQYQLVIFQNMCSRDEDCLLAGDVSWVCIGMYWCRCVILNIGWCLELRSLMK